MNQIFSRAGSSLAIALLAVMASVSLSMAVGTPAGTPITNQATVDFTDANGNPLSQNSNIVTTIVSQVAVLTVDPDRAANATPGDTLYYAHVVTNSGNGDDTIDLTAVSSNAWTTNLYFDADGSGTFTAGDTLLTDTDASGTVDTGVMIANATFNILAEVTVPAGTASGTVDTTTVTGTSAFNGAVSDTAIDTTTINAPSLSVVKSVAPVGPQPPGTVLTYSIVVTNNGTADADSVVLTDGIPANTTYVGSSMTLNAGGLTDVGGDDAGDFNVTTGNSVTVTIGTLAPAAAATVTFQVTID